MSNLSQPHSKAPSQNLLKMLSNRLESECLKGEITCWHFGNWISWIEKKSSTNQWFGFSLSFWFRNFKPQNSWTFSHKTMLFYLVHPRIWISIYKLVHTFPNRWIGSHFFKLNFASFMCLIVYWQPKICGYNSRFDKVSIKVVVRTNCAISSDKVSWCSRWHFLVSFNPTQL